MERVRMVLTPALRSSCSSRFMPKRPMCSGGGGVVSQGKEAGGVVSQRKEAGGVISPGKEAGGDSGSIWQNKIWKTSIVFLGGAAAGYLYNSKATDAGATKEETREMEIEEANERHNQKMESYKRDMERLKCESAIYDRIDQLQKTESKVLWELFWAQIKLQILEVKVMILEMKVKELAAAARKSKDAADKNE